MNDAVAGVGATEARTKIAGSRAVRAATGGAGSGHSRLCAPLAPGLETLHRRRPRDEIPLRERDSELPELVQHLPGLDALGDGLDAHGAPDLVDRAHHAFVDAVVRHVADELAVDLEVIDRQVLAVGERRQAAA